MTIRDQREEEERKQMTLWQAGENFTSTGRKQRSWGGGIKMEQILVLEGKYCKVKKSKPLQESLLIFTGLLLNVKGNIFSSVMAERLY